MSEQKQLTIAPPRLPYSTAFEAAYGVDRASWRALVDAVWPAAKTVEGVILALSYCHAKQLDPFRRVVHIVPVWNSDLKRTVEGVWPGIAAYRIDAARTGEYTGCDPTAFGDTEYFKFWSRPWTKRGEAPADDEEIIVAAPSWAQVTVYRLIGGQRCPFPGPRIWFMEYYGRKSRSDESPNDRWRTSPSYMLEKCAEAAALRKAFPEALGGEITVEEAESGAASARDVTPAPQRADFVTAETSNDPDALSPEQRAHMDEMSAAEAFADPTNGEITEPPPAEPPNGGRGAGEVGPTGATGPDASLSPVDASASPASPSDLFVQQTLVVYADAEMGMWISNYKKDNSDHYKALSIEQLGVLKAAEDQRRQELRAAQKR